MTKLKVECEANREDKKLSTKDLLNLLEDWKNQVRECLKVGMVPTPSSIIERFNRNYQTQFEDIFGLAREDRKERDHYFENIIDSRLRAVEIVENYLFIANQLNQTELKEVKTVQDKLDYILQTLYFVYHRDFYFSIETLLDLNAVPFRHDEPGELGEDLIKKKYVSVHERDSYNKNARIKLTVKGASYVERKSKSNNKQKTKKWETEINQKVDIVLEKLQTLGYGQEVIFNEIEELKTYSGKLPKKSWVQLLKGKVIDLAVDQVINKETASYILETLSEGASKLLKS